MLFSLSAVNMSFGARCRPCSILGYVAFIRVGAYSYALLLAQRLGLSFLMRLPPSGILRVLGA